MKSVLAGSVVILALMVVGIFGIMPEPKSAVAPQPPTINMNVVWPPEDFRAIITALDDRFTHEQQVVIFTAAYLVRENIIPGVAGYASSLPGLIDEVPGIRADINYDRFIDGEDLGLLLGRWGETTRPEGDTNQDGVIDGADLAMLLGVWNLRYHQHTAGDGWWYAAVADIEPSPIYAGGTRMTWGVTYDAYGRPHWTYAIDDTGWRIN